MIIAFSGPAGAGKGTLAKMLAETLGLPHYDIGLLFRTIAVLRQKMMFEEICKLDFLDLDEKMLRTEAIGLLAAQLAKDHSSQMALVAQKFIKDPNFICDGRTCGTEIYPEADFKFYITAARTERFSRRLKLDENFASLSERESLDKHRDAIPKDAIIIDTTGKTKEKCLEEVLCYEKHFVFCR